MRKILFVCTGNICRSPSAEAVFKHLVRGEGKEAEFEADSAGIYGYHVGERPDPRSISAAQRRGISMGSIRARKVHISDFREFDLILAMDRSHYDFLEAMKPDDPRARLDMFMDFGDGPYKSMDVPDPYYGEGAGFEKVLDMLEDGSKGILKATF